MIFYRRIKTDAHVDPVGNILRAGGIVETITVLSEIDGQENRQGAKNAKKYFLSRSAEGLGGADFLLGVPVGWFAKPVIVANAPDLFNVGLQRNIMIYLAILGALGVLAVFLGPNGDKNVKIINFIYGLTCMIELSTI
jgi:hypothetical protein